jgi:MFS transporter, SP family, sugar:H+ symporter
MSISTVIGFITSLIITYSNPYVEESPGNLGSRVGFVYGSVFIVAMVFVYFIVPEMKGRSLEELDELFQSKVPAWRSSGFEATGIGAIITQIDNMNSAEQRNEVLTATEIEGKLDKEKP